MDITEKVYNHMKSFMEEHGFLPTIKQTAETLHYKDYEVKEAVEKLEETGKIKITRVPPKNTVEFFD